MGPFGQRSAGGDPDFGFVVGGLHGFPASLFSRLALATESGQGGAMDAVRHTPPELDTTPAWRGEPMALFARVFESQARRASSLDKHSVNRLMVEKTERLAEVVCAERDRFVSNPARRHSPPLTHTA